MEPLRPDAPGYAAPFTLRQLECFVAVAESGSIARAADVLRASDSAVSDALTAMEKTLGCRLFDRRRSRGATLTSDGLAILSIAHRMLSDAEELSAAVGNDASALMGPVRVGAVDTLAPVIIPRLIERMRIDHPALRLDFRTGDQPSMIDALERAELDLVITFDIDVPPELRRRSLWTTHACVVVSADHPLASRGSIGLEELAEEPMVLLDIFSSRVHTLELMSSRSISPRIAYRTDNYELCRSLVARGLGYTLLMRRAIQSQTWDGAEVTSLEIDPSPRTVQILAVWTNRGHPPRVAAVVDAATAAGATVLMR